MLKIILCSILLLLPFCHADVLSQRGNYLKPYHFGSLDQAERNITSVINCEIPYENYTKSKDASWLLLDRATIRFANGDIEGSIHDYALAIDSLDYYGQDLPIDQVKQILIQDEVSAYQASDFEQVLARVYFALALLNKGDRGNAFAMLRNSEEFQNEQRALYQRLPFSRTYKLHDNPLGSYLFAAMLEKKGDTSNASIIYESLGYKPKFSRDKATVLVLCHNGNAPYKISTTCPSSVASAVALEFFLSSQRIDPAWCTMTGIPVAELACWPWSSPQPTYATINDSRLPLLPICLVQQESITELEQKKPAVVARAVARQIVRRSAVGYMKEQNEWLGLFADIGMYVANSNTRADTRSWTTLPAFIDCCRFDLEPGVHNLNLEIYKDELCQQSNHRLKLRANDLCIINVFNIHPGVTRVLIPSIYQGE